MSGRLVRPLSWCLRCALLAVVPGLFTSVAFPAPPAVAKPETFRDQLAVREAEVVVGLPPALVAERDGKLRPEDFVVRVGAEPRTVLRLVPLARESAPWRLVVVDPALAHPDTIVASLLALAREAEALASFGTVDLAVIDPSPGGSALLRAGRNLSRAQSIAFALSEAAGRARADRRRIDPRRTIPASVAAEHLAAITRFLLADPSGGPRAMALPLDPVESLTGEPPAPGLGSVPGLLSAYGWTVLPLTFAATTSFALDAPGVGAYDHWNDTSFVGRGVSILGILRWLRGKRAMPPQRARVTIESEILPERAAARGLAEATGGLAIDRNEQIRPALEALGQRYLLGYEVSAEPKNGELAVLEVTAARGSSPAVSPHFARTGASEDLADLLLAGLLAGDPKRRDLPAGVKLENGSLNLEIPAPPAPPALPADTADAVAPTLSPLRISWAIRRTDGRLETHHQLVAAPLAGGQALHVEIPFPAGADPSIDPTAVAVLLQAIGSEAAWGERFTQRN